MKLRPFELALVIIFIVMAIVSLVVLKSFKPERSPEETEAALIGSVQIWGTLPAESVEQVLLAVRKNNEGYNNVSYRYYHPDDFDTQLVNALADGEGPDIILTSHEKLIEMRKRIQPISYDSYPLRDFKNLYVDGAEIFTLSDGIYAYPVAVDPLMLYWNRDIFATEGFLQAPATWESLVNTMFASLVQRDFDRTITRSAVAMGEYQNVRNAFGILSALLIQGGMQGVLEEGSNKYLVRLQTSISGQGDPLRSAADFYTRFARPSNTLYSWNRAFQDDRMKFVSEDLAMYFGYGSEGPQLERINPNLNFDIAEIPQGETATLRRTYGKFYGLSLLEKSDNTQGATIVMRALSTTENSEMIAVASGMVPARRSLVSQGSNDKYGRLTYKSTAVALGWLNPDRAEADKIFSTLTSDINENRRDLNAAVGDASRRLADVY
ncbi:extracellular solute-binding protein [Candidatus Kaiserbacteria bacterium]|nr:extracellular solute-binding protein [Candidatus Kaiserbacteria bacterium]MCB9812051.1 extracellular solute-binding protein [Candidatus Nomurabacteria bacterium]